MHCNKCKTQKNSLCTCKPKNCGCAVKTQDKCVTVTVDLECSSIERGRTLDQVLLEMDKYLCELLELIQNSGAITITNVGTGAKVYKGIGPTGKREFKTLTSSSLTITENSNTINLEAEAPPPPDEFELTSVGTGHIIYKGLNTLGVGEVKTITSDTLEIDGSGDTIKINQPITEGIIQYIVNNKYTGQDEEGSLLKPFKTIGNAVTTFIGNGTADNPENQGATIIIQKGNTYSFSGNFSYRNLNVVLEEDVVLNHSGGWLVDYDTLNDTKADLNINIKKGASINISNQGFRNKGSLSGASGRKVINITGGGVINLTGSTPSGATMFESNYNNDSGYGMPSFQNFVVQGVTLNTIYKKIYKIGRDAEIIFDSCSIRSAYVGDTIDPATEAFDQVGGGVSIKNCELLINSVRTNCFTLSKPSTWSTRLSLDFCKLVYPGSISNFFYKKTVGNPQLQCQYMITTENADIKNIIDVAPITGTWDTVKFRYNIFSLGVISPNVDLTSGNTGTSNLLGGHNIDTLPEFTSRTAATTANLPKGAKFINTNNSDPSTATWFLDIVI